jgi:hypothetical protein
MVNPQEPTFADLRQLLADIREHGFDEAVSHYRADAAEHAAVTTWLALDNWPAVIAHLEANSEILAQETAQSLLQDLGGAAVEQRFAVLELTAVMSPEDILESVEEPTFAAERGVEAISYAELATVQAILLICPAVTSVAGSGPLLSAFVHAARGDHDGALTDARAAIHGSTPVQRQAHRIHLGRALRDIDQEEQADLHAGLMRIISLYDSEPSQQ